MEGGIAKDHQGTGTQRGTLYRNIYNDDITAPDYEINSFVFFLFWGEGGVTMLACAERQIEA